VNKYCEGKVKSTRNKEDEKDPEIINKSNYKNNVPFV